jgi:hypothetical protein
VSSNYVTSLEFEDDRVIGINLYRVSFIKKIIKIETVLERMRPRLSLLADWNLQMGKSLVLASAPSSWTRSKPNPCSEWKYPGQPFSAIKKQTSSNLLEKEVNCWL